MVALCHTAAGLPITDLSLSWSKIAHHFPNTLQTPTCKLQMTLFTCRHVIVSSRADT